MIESNRELWRGHGHIIGVYEFGFVVQRIVVVAKKNAKTGKKNKNAGAETLAAPRYYTKLCSAMQRVANAVPMREATDLKEYMRMYAYISSELKEATLGQ